MLSTAFTLFLIMNSLGMAPVLLAILKEFDRKTQCRILFRECCFALVFVLLFNFFGEIFFDWLHIKQSSIQMAGGIILFLIALRMIFPYLKSQDPIELKREEPFIVPIAIPLLAGPAVLTTVMIEAHNAPSLAVMLGAIFLAWAATTLILVGASFLKDIIGTRGLNAFERLMGLILTLLAVQMFLQGIETFMESAL